MSRCKNGRRLSINKRRIDNKTSSWLSLTSFAAGTNSRNRAYLIYVTWKTSYETKRRVTRKNYSYRCFTEFVHWSVRSINQLIFLVTELIRYNGLFNISSTVQLARSRYCRVAHLVRRVRRLHWVDDFSESTKYHKYTVTHVVVHVGSGLQWNTLLHERVVGNASTCNLHRIYTRFHLAAGVCECSGCSYVCAVCRIVSLSASQLEQ